MQPRTIVYKKFGGLDYVHWDWYKEKTIAKINANILKTKGYKVRIVKQYSDGGNWYGIWKYPITSIEFHKEHQEAAEFNLAKMVKTHSGTVNTGKF